MIFIEENESVMQSRGRNLGEIILILRLLYTLDPVTQINRVYLRVVQQTTPEWDSRPANAANR